MQWYEVRRADGTRVSSGYEDRFYSRRKALAVRDEFARRTGAGARVVRVQHTETEVRG